MEDLSRLSAVHTVSVSERAAFRLAYAEADAMDAGEQDLFSHAITRQDDAWLLCSPDKASLKAGVKLGWEDRLCSLEELANQVGVRPNPAFHRNVGSAWLSGERTHLLLER